MIEVVENPTEQHLILDRDYVQTKYNLPVVAMCGIVFEWRPGNATDPKCETCETRLREVQTDIQRAQGIN